MEFGCGPIEVVRSAPTNRQEALLPAASHLLHIDSFDAFVLKATSAMLEIEPKHCHLRCGEESVRIVLSVKNFNIGYPTVPLCEERPLSLLPRECRERGFTYSAPMFASFSMSVGESQSTTVTRSIGQLPIMVRSNR